MVGALSLCAGILLYTQSWWRQSSGEGVQYSPPHSPAEPSWRKPLQKESDVRMPWAGRGTLWSGSTVGIAMACLYTYTCPITPIFTVHRSFTGVPTQTEECEGGIRSSPSPTLSSSIPAQHEHHRRVSSFIQPVPV